MRASRPGLQLKLTNGGTASRLGRTPFVRETIRYMQLKGILLIALAVSVLPAASVQGAETTHRKKSIPQLFKMVQPAVGTVHAIEYSRKSKTTHQGNGFFVGPDGQFVTNHHVIPGNVYSAKIKLHTGQEYAVKEVLARNKEKDLLLVSVDIPVDSFTYLKVNSKLPEIGEDILVVGSPKGLDQTATRGIVASVRRDSTHGKVIQIDAPISPGSSGSPILAMDGTVIGVATFKADGENLNFSIPGKSLLELLAAGNDIGESLGGFDNPFGNLLMVKAGIPEMITHDVEELDSNQVAVISHIFDIPEEQISRFRWGPSVAAPPNRLAGSIWYTIWYDEDDIKLNRTVRIDSTSNVLDTEANRISGNKKLYLE